jgi:effector-binding domain-containing protein
VDKKGYISQIREDLRNGVRHTKVSIENLGKKHGIENKNLVKEFTELAIVLNARDIAQSSSFSVYEKYLDIVSLYQSQVNLSMRTSMSVLMQQYSTPAPISFLASSYVLKRDSLSGYKAFKNIVKGGSKGKIVGNAHLHPEKTAPLYLEPSAGNGLLTIALPYQLTHVNELDDVRLSNLKEQPFAKVSSWDALHPPYAYQRKFDGVVTNPPFGALNEPMMFGKFKIKRLEHAMCLKALQCMKDNGRAAIIIGGHTSWDEQGRVTAGHNRIFLNYLFHFYHVEDIIPINGKKLYSRQGTSFDTRLILINGTKFKPDGAAPLKNTLHSTVVNSHEELWDRVGLEQTEHNQISKVKLKAKAIRLKQKQLHIIDSENNFEKLHHEIINLLNQTEGVTQVSDGFENPNKYGATISHITGRYNQSDKWNYTKASFNIDWNRKVFFAPDFGYRTLPENKLVHVETILNEAFPKLFNSSKQ